MPEGRPAGAALVIGVTHGRNMITETQSKLDVYRERLDELRGFL
jgi:hypothetical protein